MKAVINKTRLRSVISNITRDSEAALNLFFNEKDEFVKASLKTLNCDLTSYMELRFGSDKEKMTGQHQKVPVKLDDFKDALKKAKGNLMIKLDGDLVDVNGAEIKACKPEEIEENIVSSIKKLRKTSTKFLIGFFNDLRLYTIKEGFDKDSNLEFLIKPDVIDFSAEGVKIATFTLDEEIDIKKELKFVIKINSMRLLCFPKTFKKMSFSVLWGETYFNPTPIEIGVSDKNIDFRRVITPIVYDD